MKKFQTVSLPIAGICVQGKSGSAREIMAAILTYFSVASDIENIAQDLSDLGGSKPTLSALRSFIQEELRVARSAVDEFLVGGESAAEMYFSAYPHARSQRKVSRFMASRLRCNKAPAYPSTAKSARKRRAANRKNRQS